MLTRQQIANQIRELSNQERVKLARLNICSHYIQLYDEKNLAIDRGQSLTWAYDKKVLQQIRNILTHTHANWVNETDEQRKGSLNNLVRATLLLRRNFTTLYNQNYLAQRGRAEEVNFWRNIQFLIQYQITPQDQRVQQSMPISYSVINSLLTEMRCLIDTVLRQEVRLLTRLQPTYDAYGDNWINLPQDRKQLEKMRNPYRNPHQLPILEAVSTYGREKLRISKMLAAIRLARTLDVSSHAGKIAFLRQLQIIGESSTGKNFTKVTKRLMQDVDWQLLIQMRNKLSHNEWDIHSGHLQTHLTTANLQSMQQDLVALDNSIESLQHMHNNIGNSANNLLSHYDPAWYLRPKTRQTFMDFIRDCYIAGVIDKPRLLILRGLLGNDIRGEHLPTLIRPFIEQIFDRNNVDYNNTKHLLPKFQKLMRAFANEVAYHRNLENPNGHTQRRTANRLAGHQVNIRNFNNLLNYNEDTYNHDWQHQNSSFNSTRLIRLIQQEISDIQHLLYPLPGSGALFFDYPEDTTQIPLNEDQIAMLHNILNLSNRADYREAQSAIQNIQTYCTQMQKPFYLDLDGLHWVSRGEIGNLNFQTFLQNIPNLLKPIKRFGDKCVLYNSLYSRPDIVEACFYHLARIQKYVVVLKLSDDVNEDLLPNVEEFKALRNFIHHGLDLFETMDMSPLELMVRYASMFINKLQPAVNNIESNIQERLRTRNRTPLLTHGLHRRTPSAQLANLNTPAAQQMRRMSH